MRALLKTLKMTSDPAAVQRMRGTIDAIWAIFDDDGSGTLDQQEVGYAAARLGERRCGGRCARFGGRVDRDLPM